MLLHAVIAALTMFILVVVSPTITRTLNCNKMWFYYFNLNRRHITARGNGAALMLPCLPGQLLKSKSSSRAGGGNGCNYKQLEENKLS